MQKKPCKTTVICVEGCHGTGKSTFVKFLAEEYGIETMDENFLIKYPLEMHPQTMEHQWITGWFHRLMNSVSYEEEKFYVVDRSPFSSIFYTKEDKGAIFKPLIDMLVKEMKERANIHIVTVCIQVKRETLWKRIQSRLKKQPFRKNFNEDKKEWMDKICDMYEEFDWDFVLSNDKPMKDFPLLAKDMFCLNQYTKQHLPGVLAY